MMVLSVLLYSLTDETAWELGEVWASSCATALYYLAAGLKPGWAIHVLACGVAT